MGVVEFSAHLYPVTRVGFDAVEQGRSSNLAIRIALLRSHDLPPEIKSGTTHVWAIVQERPGQPDRFLVGAQATSMTEASAQAEAELRRQEARLALSAASRPGPRLMVGG